MIQIEFLTKEFGQQFECIDPIDSSRNSEQFQQFAEQWNALDIQRPAQVAKILQDEQKNPPPHPRSTTRFGVQR